jgi:hypothetical protein
MGLQPKENDAMNARMRGLLLAVAAVVVLAGSSSATQLPVAHAGTGSVLDGMPSQATIDLSSSDPRNSGGQAGWGDMAGGVAARPYVKSLTVINGATATPVVTDGSTASAPPPVGGVTTVVSPLNLCRAGQAPSPNVCYATPNRVALAVTYRADATDGWNFANPSVPVTPAIDANTVIDMTVALNSLGKSLRWTGVSGDLLYWQTTNLGQDDATVRIKFRPAAAPYVGRFPDGSGCTATPIFNCAVASADAEVLTASMVFSLDNTLDPALTGAVFATQNAISGFLQPGGTAQAPSLEIQVSSTHNKSDGTPQLGTLKAFIPTAGLVNLYGVLPSDAVAFTTTRAGDAGTNDAPTYTPWTPTVQGSDGLLVTVQGITFSVPKYRVASKLRPIRTYAKVRGTRTTIKAMVSGCRLNSKCFATVYDLGPRRAARFAFTKRPVLTNVVVYAKTLSLTGPAARLKKGHRYLLVVHSAKHNKLLASAVGTIS